MTTITAADTTRTPEGVPLPKWAKAVELIRAEAAGAPSFWALWCRAYRRHLRGHGDGVTFHALFAEYESAGGTGGPYGAAEHPVPAPHLPRVAFGTVNVTSDT